jgi:rRNA pseudouridine-1189 N-methylase Emg1 (Nep1/Mra1 family)
MNKDGSLQKNLDIRTNTDDVVWIDNNTLLATQYSRSGGSATFFTQSLIKETGQEIVQSLESKIVNQILLTANNKIALFENAEGVFAFQLN